MTKRTTAARWEETIDELRRSLCDEVREQFELLREEVADRDAQILKLLNQLQQRTVEPPAPAVAKPGDEQWEYEQMIERMRSVVVGAVPNGATVAVASKGDPEMLRFDNRAGWHFPRWDDGSYTGFHPKDSSAAIQEVERVCAWGARYLVFPATSLWWLEHYTELAKYLRDQFEIVARDDRTCVVYRMQEAAKRRIPLLPSQGSEDSHFARQLRGVITSILPPDSSVLVVSNGDPELVELGRCIGMHFPQDGDGDYAGYHPADSETAISHLEELRDEGARYLVFPKPSAWWLDHYVEFRRHLESRYRTIIRQRHVCTMFDLNGR
jgi:hypothetical protein